MTTAALFAGFYALLTASLQHFSHAAIAILIAAIFDGLDGRIARLTNTQTPFGGEYDSLSDVIAFGVAPAFLIYHSALMPLKSTGIAVSFVYCACTALRLARFNVEHQKADTSFFKGLPSPVAAVILATLVLFYSDHNMQPWPWFVAVLTLAVALLMVSGIRYESFKRLTVRHLPIFALLVLVLGFALVVLDPPTTLFILAMSYLAFGPLRLLWRFVRRKKNLKSIFYSKK